MLRKILRSGMILLLLAAVLFTAFGCSLNGYFDASGWHSNKTPDIPESLQLVYSVYSETFADEEDGVPILEAKIVYPQIKNADGIAVYDEINRYFAGKKDEYLSDIAGDGLNYAKGDKKAAAEAGYEFVKHVYTQMPHVRYNGSGFLSVLCERVEDTGGAHPNVYQTADNFNLKTGRRLALTDLLGQDAMKTVYGIVRKEIRQTEKTDKFIYYETYEEDAKNFYSQEDFYLSGENLFFFYQPNTIAPYAAGIPAFDIALNDFRIRANIPDSPSIEALDGARSDAFAVLERNAVIFCEIYGVGMLDMNVPADAGKSEYLFPVTDPRFTRFDELRDYLAGTYVGGVAEELLGNGRYADVYGSLYGDRRKDTDMSYYVNWKAYSFEISGFSDSEARLTVYTTNDTPSGARKLTLSANLIKENGVWLLDRMVY